MSQRLKITVAYDGSAFMGWQSQSHRKTVQDQIEHAVHRITGVRTRVHGAGRTDTGVHALAQCAHIDVPDRRLPATGWAKALNGVLPSTIRVLRCRYVSSDFHARFSAKGKTYRYRIFNGPILPPLELKRVWHVRVPLSIDLLSAAGRKFVGQHDFSAFAANRGKKEDNTVRRIWSLDVKRRGPAISVEVSGDGFLYKMVRLMVGAMVQVGLGKEDPGKIDADLTNGRVNGVRLAGPGCGLYLIRVWY